MLTVRKQSSADSGIFLTGKVAEPEKRQLHSK